MYYVSFPFCRLELNALKTRLVVPHWIFHHCHSACHQKKKKNKDIGGKVPLTHHHGSIMVLKRTMYLGDLKVLRVFRIATIPLCQNLRGRQLILFNAPSWKYTGTQQGDTSWGPQKAQPSPKTRFFFHFFRPKQYGACFAVSPQRDLIWL